MILSDKEIMDLAIHKEMLTPYEPVKIGNGVISFGQSSAGYDIRLADEMYLLKHNHHIGGIVDPKHFDKNLLQKWRSEIRYITVSELYQDPEYIASKVFYLPPHSYALGVSMERFKMPDDVMGICVGKSTYARAGLIINTTPIEPGWEGYLTIELSNPTDNTIVVYQGEGICQVVFFKTQEKVGSPYGDGKYQNQGDEPVPCKMF